MREGRVQSAAEQRRLDMSIRQLIERDRRVKNLVVIGLAEDDNEND